jgi:hypothetical protein
MLRGVVSKKKMAYDVAASLGLVDAAVPRWLIKHAGIGNVKDGSYNIDWHLLCN